MRRPLMLRARAAPARRALLVGLALVAAFVGCAGPVPAGSGVVPAIELEVASAPGDAITFLPVTIGAPAHTPIRVTFRNESGQAHNLTFGSPIAAGTRTIVDPGASDGVVFTTPGPGTYEFVCTIHMGMSGNLTVT